MYRQLRSLLFKLDPAQAQVVALKCIQLAYQLGLSRYFANTLTAPRTVMGLTFPNPVGLAAGLDDNAEYVDALASLGFGFLEVGGVTPKPQEGNPRPRLFRLTEQEAIINRKGFANKGVEYAARQLEKMRYRGIIGVNVTKNRDTPLDHAIDDYLFCFRVLSKYISYLSVNVSSPNTPGLRALQQNDFLRPLLSALKQEQAAILEKEKKYIPLVVKIAPDLTEQEVSEIAHTLLEQRIDGVIATNTTLSRQGVESSPFANEAGGLSGKPLCARSTEVIRQLHAILQDQLPIIGLGGIMDAASAKEKFAAGASLLQIYTGFIYEGPDLICRIVSICDKEIH